MELRLQKLPLPTRRVDAIRTPAAVDVGRIRIRSPTDSIRALSGLLLSAPRARGESWSCDGGSIEGGDDEMEWEPLPSPRRGNVGRRRPDDGPCPLLTEASTAVASLRIGDDGRAGGEEWDYSGLRILGRMVLGHEDGRDGRP